MTGDEFKAALAALGHSQASFSVYTDTGKRTVATWAKEGPPHSISLLLGWMKRTSVEPAPPMAEQTKNSVKLAIMPVIGHVIGMAHLAGYDGSLVAEAVVEIADDYYQANKAASRFVNPDGDIAKRA